MNPAIPLLLKFHFLSRLRGLRQTCTSPRRIMLMLVVVALGMAWLGQTVASVLFRAPYAPTSFSIWTSSILSLYFGWHFIRVAYRRPESAIEWSETEAAQIVGGPFSRRDVLVYRFLVILTSTLPKALLTAFVLLPDLWWSGPLGILLALVFLESFRMAIDIAVCCLSQRGYLIARSVVFAVAVLLVVLGFQQAGLLGDRASAGLVVPGQTLLDAFMRPSHLFADIITAQHLSGSLVLNVLCASLMVGGLLVLIGWLDRRHASLLSERQFAMCQEQERSDASNASDVLQGMTLPYVPRMATIGPIFWRQLKSAYRYRGSLVVAIAIPGALSCLPLVTVSDPTHAFLALVAAVVFYSFILLPEAIKFDFRLDCDHLTQLKMLPISPLAVVSGQLAVPLLVATLFQITLYLLAGFTRAVAPELVLAAIVLTVPINLLFVSIDNLIFLLYPHRPTQEGFEAFVRTILKFTFKSVLLGVAGAFVVFWATSSRYVVDLVGMPDQVLLLFISGVCVAAWMLAVAFLIAVTYAFKQFDVSVSVPA